VNSSVVYEIIGYVASAFIIASLLQRSILRLRLIGLVGAIGFVVYSVLIAAYPIAVVNLIAAGIHLYFLRKLSRYKHEVFSVLHVDANSRYLARFLEYYHDEIAHRFQPEFSYEPRPDEMVAFILRDMVPAGLFIGRRHDDRSVEVELDFVIPQYRDFKIGPYLYSPESGVFTGSGCTRAWAVASTPEHIAYLERMGFHHDPTVELPDRYVVDLESGAAVT